MQAETKARYDKHAKERHFDVSDQVLVLMPVTSIKLTAQWTGPYLVENKLSPVTYTVRMLNKRKKTRTIHINMMKLWHPPAAAVFPTSQKPVGEDDLVLDKHSFTTLLEADTGLTLGPDLTTEPPLSYSVEKRRDPKNCAIFLGPASSQHYNSGGGSPEKINKTTKSQLMPLATFVPSLGRCGQGPWLSILLGIRKCFFLMTLACLDISSKKMCLYRLFIYHFKAHTISNKLV